MESSGSQNNSWQANAVQIGLISVGAAILGFSIIEVVSTFNALSRIGVVVASVFVSILLSRYEPRIAGTDMRISLKTIFGFWGVIWLGISGGVLLAACSSAANRGISTAHRKRVASSVAADVLSTFFSGIAFYLSLAYFENAGRWEIAGKLSVANEIIFASCVMALTHFAQSRALAYILRHKDFARHQRAAISRVLLIPAANSLISLLATVCFFIVFSHFGIEFGLVIIPVAILGHLSYRIHVRSLEQKTKQITEASRIHLATVEALATAIDARDQMSIGHVRRTQIYAVGLGNILGLGEDEINALRTGALLHDIGKLAVPDHILSKPGRLTPAEMEKIKTHSLVGASILEKVGFPYPVVPTVKYHHEFWDGCGYPEGLRGTNIPLTARVLAIADAYDTLRVARPYRHAVSQEEACNFLRTRSGTQFDPRLVDVFLRNLKIFEIEIKAQQLFYETDLDAAVSVSDVFDSAASPNYVEQIKRANREVFALYSLARDFSSEIDLDEILPLFTQKIRELIPCDTSVVYLLDEKNDSAEAVYVEGKNKGLFSGKTVKVGEGATGSVLKNRLPSDGLDPALDFDFSQTEVQHEYRAMASIPLIADDKLIGAISLYSCEMSRYQDEHLRLLETVSRIAADAISKSLEHAVTENYALTDPMTGLPNARSLQIHFDKEVKRADRSESSFQLLVLDLDGFKSVNDTHGHKVGDRMLKEIGSIIQSQLREYDFLSRYGGDEFVAIVPDTDNTDVMELARRIEEAVTGFSLTVDQAVARVGVSVGTACYPIHGETFDQIIVSADKAMYLTKSFHRKRAATLEPDDRMLRPPVSLPEELTEFATIKAVTSDGLILEVDETHIVASTAIN
ncbi:MAG TPA: diguanylate cyclase [Pyrinomonadaceae bacterium]|nr:diguanylate cyclase [Pyrinomonadaceae bacterium]